MRHRWSCGQSARSGETESPGNLAGGQHFAEVIFSNLQDADPLSD